jgi:hypothetical protein
VRRGLIAALAAFSVSALAHAAPARATEYCAYPVGGNNWCGDYRYVASEYNRNAADYPGVGQVYFCEYQGGAFSHAQYSFYCDDLGNGGADNFGDSGGDFQTGEVMIDFVGNFTGVTHTVDGHYSNYV